MASQRRPSTIYVAVCGLTSSSYPGLSGQGAGKSCLCNRFVHPKKDDLRLNHHSVLNHSEFGTKVINNTHFLYWGEKVVVLEDGQDVTFQIVEHTEFVDDSSLKPFFFTKPYYKRCTQLKLQSGGKVTYIEPDQLSLPEQYTDVGEFPDKFIVDSFIVCVDVSLDFEKPGNPQRDFFDKLLHNVISTKKPVVVACTKFDRALDHSVVAVNEMVLKTKRHIPVIEVSALKGVNVNLCFLILCHLVDTKKPRTHIATYSDAKQHLDDRIRKNEYSFQYVLDDKLTDFSMSIEAASAMLHNEVEFQLLRELCGIERLHKLVRAKLNYLKKEAVEKKLAHTLEQLPAMLDTLLPELPLEANVNSCVRMLKEREKSMECLVDVDNWREDHEYLKKTTVVVPLSLFSEEQGRGILQKHIDKVLNSVRAEVAYERLHKALESSTGLIPGANMYKVFNELCVWEEMSRVPEQRLRKLYQDHMVHLEQECVSDVKELLLERSDLFAQVDAADVLGRVDQELASYDRYRRLDKRPDLRKSTVIKHIANLQWPDKGPYARSHLLEVLQSAAPIKDSLVPPSHPISSDNLQWMLAPDDQVFNLAILARTETNALTLRSDFMNHLGLQETCKINDRRYQLEMKLFQGPQRSLTSKEFVPQGAVAVVTSMECLDWLDNLLNELWVPGGNTKPRYRGMPLVILAVDECIEEDNTNNTNGSNADSELWKRAKLLAHRVQSVCITEHLPIIPKRLMVTNVIHTLLVSLIDSVKQCDRFLNSDLSLEPEGLNIAMFSLTGDPYSNLHLLSLWLDHQLVWFSEKDGCLFLRAAIDKQHQTCSISFHSALNIMDLKASIRLGFILVYSAERPASLAVIRSLLPKLPKLPILLVAMAMGGSSDSQLLEEGHTLAEQWKASFVSSNEQTWSIEHISEFFSKCWFSRFSSWNAQDMPEEVNQRPRQRKPVALPDRPKVDRAKRSPSPNELELTKRFKQLLSSPNSRRWKDQQQQQVRSKPNKMPQDTKLGNLAVELGGKEKEEIMQDPVLLKRDYSLTELGLEDEPPPLPSRNYSWSDIEDSDEESSDNLDKLPAQTPTSDHLGTSASVSHLAKQSVKDEADKEVQLKLRQQIVKKDDFIESLRIEREELRQQMVEKDQFIQSLQSEKTTLTQQIVKKDRSMQSLQSEKERFRQQVVEKDQFMQSLQSERERFRQQVVEKDRFIQSLQSEKERFRQQVVEKDRSMQSLQSEKERFRQQVVEKDQFIQSLQSEKEGLRQQIATLRQQVQRNASQPQSGQSYQSKFWEVPREDISLNMQKILGTGAWGFVMEGTFRGQRVAVKCLHDMIREPYFLEIIRKEIDIMAQIRHPNLVMLIAAVIDAENDPLVVTELLDMSLRKAYERNLLEGSSKLNIFRDIASALNYLHLHHHGEIIHRDVSSANVLLEAKPNNQWKAKLSDFGSAKLALEAKTKGPGAPVYAAPEVMREMGIRQTAKVDVYSYGILLCEVTMGQFPLEERLPSMIQAIRDSWVFMHGLITACIQEHPDNRPAMSHVLTELNKLRPN